MNTKNILILAVVGLVGYWFLKRRRMGIAAAVPAPSPEVTEAAKILIDRGGYQPGLSPQEQQMAWERAFGYDYPQLERY